MNIQFQKRNVENEHVIKFLQQLICEHFNLVPVEVVFSSRNTEEFIFKIKAAEILVCSSRQAISNMRDIVDEPKDISLASSQIGLYKHLGNSQYYFRWLDRI